MSARAMREFSVHARSEAQSTPVQLYGETQGRLTGHAGDDYISGHILNPGTDTESDRREMCTVRYSLSVRTIMTNSQNDDPRSAFANLLAALLAALRPTLPALYPELLCPKPCDAVVAVRA